MWNEIKNDAFKSIVFIVSIIMFVVSTVVTLIGIDDTYAAPVESEILYTVKVCTDESVSDCTSTNVAEGKDFVLPTAPEKDGFVFEHWAVTPKGSSDFYSDPGQKIQVTADTIITPAWKPLSDPKPKTYKLTFDVGEGEFVKPGKNLYSDQNKENVVDVVYDSSNYSDMSSDVPKRCGYNFSGWYTDENHIVYDSSGMAKVNVLSKSYWAIVLGEKKVIWKGNSDLTVYAKWDEVPEDEWYNVTYDLNGGKFSDAFIDGQEDSIENDSVFYDNAPFAKDCKFTVSEYDSREFSRKGYTFIGWKDQYGTKIEPGEMPWTYTEDVTLYAQWDKNESTNGSTEATTYSVTYNANGGFSVPDAQTKKAGEKLKLTTEEPVNKKMFKFIEWNDKPDGTGASYNPGDWYSDDKDIILYAKWEKVVDFVDDPNGTDENDGTGDSDNNDDNPDQDITDPDDIPTGDALIYIVWIVGIGALGYTVYYYSKRRNDI